MSTQYTGTKVPSTLDSPLPLSRDQRVGLEAENWVFEQLTQRGYSPIIPPDFFKSACDMHVNGLCVEVKVAKRTKRKQKLANGKVKLRDRWQWFIHPTHPKTEYVLILVADDAKKNRYAFILSGSMVGERSHLQLTSHPEKYNGWMAAYRDKWSMIDFLASQAYKEYPLFENWDRLAA